MKKKLLIGFTSLVVLGIIIYLIIPKLETRNLNISPVGATPSETVTIALQVQNTGKIQGTHKLALEINGKIEQTEVVTLGGGETRSVSFSVEKDIEGSYSVRLGRLQGVFEVVGSGLNTLTVHFIDVGLGDAILLDIGDTEVLIDGGDKSPSVVSYIDDYIEGPLEVMVATHPHADHIGGLIAVLKDFEVDEIWLNGDTSTSKTYSQFMSAVNTEGAEVHVARRGDTIQAGNLTFNVLHPTNLDDDINNNSIVLSLSYGQVDFLFTGDVEEEAEASMLVQSVVPVPDVEILKVGHHGSRTASSMQFLQVIEPECAIYMTSQDNPYGFPHEEAIINLCEVGAEIYGTDIHGTIVVTTNGETYDILPSNNIPPVACPSATIFDLTISANGQGATNPSVGTYEYDNGIEVTITASPSSGWEFDHWSGDVNTITDVNADSTTILVNGSYSIIANFQEVDVAPDFTLSALTGVNITLSELEGTPVVLNFWSIGCTYCRQQLPYLENVAQASGGVIEIIVVNIVDSAARLQSFFGDYEPVMKVLLDNNGETFKTYCQNFSNPQGYIPFTLFVDGEGNVQYKKVGAFSSETALWDALHDVFGL